MTRPTAARRPSATKSPPTGSAAWPGLGTALLVYFALALLYFAPALLPGRHIFGTDYLNAGYFFYDFVHERFAAGDLPKWVPYVFGGLPLFSNPGSTYYPIRWLAGLLMPAQYFFPFVLLVQFALAGAGTYLLLRELAARPWVAFVTGIAFQWTGILTSWVYAGHDGRIIVVSLAPLFLYFLHAGVRSARILPFVGAAGTLGFVLLSFQIQNAYYLLLAGLAWAAFLLVHFGHHRQPRQLAIVVALGIAAVGFGFLLASVNFLPFQDYVSASPRGMTGGRGYEYSTSYSMPPRALAGLAVPEQVGATIQNDRGEYVFPVYRGDSAFRLHTEYVGALVLVLLALGIAYSRRDRYWWFFGGLGAFALSLALGGNTPLYRIYYAVLPGLARFRAPDLAYYLLALALVCMAGITLERLAARRDASELDASRLLWIGGGVAAAAVLGAMTFGAGSAAMAEGTSGLSPAAGWLRFAIFAGAVACVLWTWAKLRIGYAATVGLLALLTIADLWLVGKKFFMAVDAPETMFAPDDVVSFLRSRGGPDRFWAIPGQSAWPPYLDYPMRYELHDAGGEHGNQLQRYNEFAGTGSGSYIDYHNFLSDARFLAAANVRWLISSVPIETPLLREAYRGRTAIVYENTLSLPRAYLVPAVTRVHDPQATLPALRDSAWDPARAAVVESPTDLDLPAGPLDGSAEIVVYEPDRVVVRTRADRAAFLVLSDNMYHGWRARIGGVELPVYRTNHTFRGVRVPAGEQLVEFRFEPTALYTGLYMTLAAFALLIVLAAGLWWKGRAASPETLGR